MLCAAIACSTMRGSTVVSSSTLGGSVRSLIGYFVVVASSTLGGSTGSLIGCSAVVAYSTLGGSAGSLIGYSTISGAIDVAFEMGAEEEGCSELAIE